MTLARSIRSWRLPTRAVPRRLPLAPALVLGAVGAVVAVVAVGWRTIAGAAAEPHHPEPPVIVWDG